MGKKAKKQKVFNPPTRYPQNIVGEMQRIRAELNAQRTKDSNDTFNLVVSTVMIVLKELHEFTTEQLDQVIDEVLEQLELAGKELVNIDQIMELCASYGLKVTQPVEKMEDIGKMMTDKIKVYELLDRGITEVEDLASKVGISSRAASGLRWLWNKEKFGKDYEGDVEMKTKKELCYELFNKGLNTEKVVEETELMKTSVATYYSSWKKDTLKELTTEEAAPYFAGEKELWQIRQEKLEGATDDTVEEVPKSEEPVQERADDTTEVVSDDAVEEKAPVRKGLCKKVTVTGEFAEYRPSAENLVDIELYGQVLTVTKDEMLTLVEEFKQIAEDQDLWKGAM